MRLAELLDMSVLRTLTEANYRANGMPVSVIDAADGSVLIGQGWQDICVQFHRADPRAADRCRESDAYVGNHLSERMPCEYTCLNGLRHIGIPILVEGEHLATLFLGQFFHEGEAPDREYFVRQARQFGFDETPYLAALDRVPVFSRSAVENILQYDMALARFVADLAERALAHVRIEEALRETDRRKSEFIAALSHELRNPLAPIQNSLYLLEHGDRNGEQARRALRVANRQMRHMTRIVDDLVDVMRLSQGKCRLQRQRLDLSELVRHSVEDHRSAFVERGLRLDVKQAGERVCVDGDVTRLSQVIGNLLRNAAKFTDAGGSVLVSVESAERDAVLRVRDDGVGIAPHLLDGVFEPFVQADATLDRARGGLGLGLALVKNLVELHGGTVRACSEGEGRGAELIVTLPLADPYIGAEERRATLKDASTRRRVLVIEDNLDAATTLRDVLELDGHEVHLAVDGLQGIEAALRVRPEVVVCDIGLPGIDGYEVARRLRSAAAQPRMTLVALTGYVSPDDVQRAADAGFHHYVGKPPDVEKLSQIVRRSPAHPARSGS